MYGKIPYTGFKKKKNLVKKKKQKTKKNNKKNKTAYVHRTCLEYFFTFIFFFVNKIRVCFSQSQHMRGIFCSNFKN